MITFEMSSTSVQDLIASSQIQDFLSILGVICTLSAFDGLPKASDSLFHVILINGRLGTFVKTPNLFGSFSICWKEWKAGRM
jgi:hypothetical protein